MQRAGRTLATMFCIAGLAVVPIGCDRSARPSPTSDAPTSPANSTITTARGDSPSQSTSMSSLSTSEVSSTSSEVPLTDRARSAAIAAYLGMWADFATAGHTSDWRSPLLSRHATAYALQVLEKSLYTDHQNGVITKGAPVDHPRVKSVRPAHDPTVVLISDCGDSSRTRKYVVKTGKPTGSPGGRQAITAEVRKQPDGSWKVDQFAVEGVGTC